MRRVRGTWVPALVIVAVIEGLLALVLHLQGDPIAPVLGGIVVGALTLACLLRLATPILITARTRR